MNKIDRKQQMRSLETRAKLIEAVLDVIYEVGFHSATTQAFAERAQVSRGALLHHFPARSDIILAAMEHLLYTGIRQIRVIIDDVENDRISLEEFIEILWSMFSSRFEYLSFEFINAARTDNELRDQMVPIVKQFHAEIDKTWLHYNTARKLPRDQAITMLNLTLCLVRGMGTQTILKDDAAYYRNLIEAWKKLMLDTLRSKAGSQY